MSLVLFVSGETEGRHHMAGEGHWTDELSPTLAAHSVCPRPSCRLPGFPDLPRPLIVGPHEPASPSPLQHCCRCAGFTFSREMDAGRWLWWGGYLEDMSTSSRFHSWAELGEVGKAVGIAGCRSCFLLNNSVKLYKLHV